MKPSIPPLPSLADRLDAEAIKMLGSPYCETWPHACRAWDSRKQVEDAGAWVTRAYDLLRANVATVDPARVDRSPSNWRLRRTTKAGRLPEAILERSFIAAAGPRWWNQLPAASGLVRSKADRSMRIDLVYGHKSGNGYDFIELKVANENPLYAAVEVLRYGFLWLHTRERGFYPKRPVIAAKTIGLGVLAPERFYKGIDTSAFERAFNDALAEVKRKHEVELSFRFARFGPDFDEARIGTYEGSALVDFFGRAWPNT